MPTVSDLTDMIGREVNAEQAEAVLKIVTAMASAYTRGNGFLSGMHTVETVKPDLEAVVLSAAARLLSDPTQNLAGETMGPFGKTYRGGFTGWSVAELFVLNRYRERAK